MAMGQSIGGEGNFDVEPMSAHRDEDADMDMKPGKKGAMRDHERGAGKPIKHTSRKLPSQANPDHGYMHEKDED